MQDMQPDNMNQEPIGAHGQPDREGAMAKADLYKLANYSLKLFKKMQDDDQLEGWVQAKITKAADYIASVYHYLEYEMEFSEYGAKLDNSEMYSESQKTAIKNRLMEAKSKVAELKKLQAVKVKEAFDEKSKVGDTFKTKTGVATKTDTGVVHKNTSYADDGDADEKSGKGKKSHAKAQSAAEKKDRAPALKQSKTGTWGMKDSQKFDNRKTNESLKGKQKELDADKDGDIEADDLAALRAKKEKKVDEAKGKKPDFLDMDKDGDKKEPMKKAVADKKKNPFAKKDSKVDEAKTCNETHKGESCPVHGMKECPMEEAAKPSAGMTKKEKSATVKSAKAGKDIGKPGKSFDKVAKAAGGGEKGEKIAAAAMWKNKAKSLKESLAALSGEVAVEEAAMDQMDSTVVQLLQRAKEMDPSGLQSAMQGGPEKLDTFLKSVLDKIEAKVDAGNQQELKFPGGQPQGEFKDSDLDPQELAQNNLQPGMNEPQFQYREGTETTRMRDQIARLNRNEQLQVNESSEAAQLRKLAKLLG